MVKLRKFKIFKLFSILLSVTIFCVGFLFYIQEAESANLDYDAEIEALEKKAQELQQENKEREQKIEEYKDDINEQAQYKELAQEAVNGIFKQIEANDALIGAKQNSIDQTLIEINSLENEIRHTEVDILEKKSAVEQLHSENLDNIKQFGQIIKAMYMTDDFDMMSMLAGSSDFFDLLVRSELVTNIGEKNLDFMNSLLDDISKQEDLIEKLEQQEQNLTNDKIILEQNHLKLENEMLSFEQTKNELQSQLVDAEAKLYKYTSDINATQNLISGLRWSISASNAEVEELNEQVAELIRAKQRAAAGQQTVYSTDGFRWPLENNFQLITTYFGYDSWRAGNHYGIDVGNSGINGSNIYAAQSGTVIRSLSGDNSMWGGGFGNYLIIDHGDGISTVYAHCQAWSIRFNEGDAVEKGDVIALVGGTGWATGPHLHFEVRVNGSAVNPFNYTYE